MFGQDKPDVYGRVSLGAEVLETSVASNSVEAAWTQWAEWLVEEVAGHVVEVNMWDRSGPRSSEVRRGHVPHVCRDKASSDEFLGHAAVDLGTMTQVPRDQGQQGNTANTSTLAPNTVRWHNLVTIHKHLIMNVLRRVVAKLQPVSWRPSKYRAVSGEAELELLWRPLSPAVSPRPAPAPPPPRPRPAAAARHPRRALRLPLLRQQPGGLHRARGRGAAPRRIPALTPGGRRSGHYETSFDCFDRQQCPSD